MFQRFLIKCANCEISVFYNIK